MDGSGREGGDNDEDDDESVRECLVVGVNDDDDGAKAKGWYVTGSRRPWATPLTMSEGMSGPAKSVGASRSMKKPAKSG